MSRLVSYGLILACAVVFCTPQITNAGFEIAVSSDNLHWTNVTLTAGSTELASSQVVAPAAGSTITAGGVTLSLISMTSNYNTDATDAHQTAVNGQATGVGTIYIAYSISGWLDPQAPPGSVDYSTSMGVTLGNKQSNGTASITSYVDTANGLVTGTTDPTLLSHSQGPEGVAFHSGTPIATDYSSPTGDSSISALASPYSIVADFKLTLTAPTSGSNNIAFHGSVELFNDQSTGFMTTPTPSSFAVFSLGACVVGFCWKRRQVVAL